MTPQDITTALENQFGRQCQVNPPDAWQVETDDFRLLALLSADQSWLRLLVPIVPQQEVQPFLNQILDANFDQTQEARYATHQGILWGVFQHDLACLELVQFQAAIDRLLTLKQQGVDPFFNSFVEGQVRQIIAAAKLQGQSLETTMQTLDRFYAEGMLGDLAGEQQGAGSYQEEALSAWRYQLERLWPEVQVPSEEK